MLESEAGAAAAAAGNAQVSGEGGYMANPPGRSRKYHRIRAKIEKNRTGPTTQHGDDHYKHLNLAVYELYTHIPDPAVVVRFISLRDTYRE